MSDPQNMYVCDLCHEEFEGASSHEDALAEAVAMFGDAVAKPEDRGVVCDDCWPEVRRWLTNQGLI